MKKADGCENATVWQAGRGPFEKRTWNDNGSRKARQATSIVPVIIIIGIILCICMASQANFRGTGEKKNLMILWLTFVAWIMEQYA